MSLPSFTGIYMSFVDVTDNFSGIYTGAAYAFANVASILQPTLLAYAISGERSLEQYRRFYAIISSVAVCGKNLFIRY